MLFSTVPCSASVISNLSRLEISSAKGSSPNSKETSFTSLCRFAIGPIGDIFVSSAEVLARGCAE